MHCIVYENKILYATFLLVINSN